MTKGRFDRLNPRPSVEHFRPTPEYSTGDQKTPSRSPRIDVLSTIGRLRELQELAGRARRETDEAFMLVPEYYRSARPVADEAPLERLCIASTDADYAFRQVLVAVPNDRLDDGIYYSYLRGTAAPKIIYFPASRGFTELSGILYRYFEEEEVADRRHVEIVSVERTSLVSGRVMYSNAPGEYHSYESDAGVIAEECLRGQGRAILETLVMQRIFVGLVVALESAISPRHS